MEQWGERRGVVKMKKKLEIVCSSFFRSLPSFFLFLIGFFLFLALACTISRVTAGACTGRLSMLRAQLFVLRLTRG